MLRNTKSKECRFGIGRFGIGMPLSRTQLSWYCNNYQTERDVLLEARHKLWLWTTHGFEHQVHFHMSLFRYSLWSKKVKGEQRIICGYWQRMISWRNCSSTSKDGVMPTSPDQIKYYKIHFSSLVILKYSLIKVN